MRIRSATVLGVGLLLFSAPTAYGDLVQVFSGNNVNAPTFNRPNRDLQLSNNIVPYRAQVFVGPTEDLGFFSACAIYSVQNFHGFIHLYGGSFDPNHPLTNLIESTDYTEGLGEEIPRIPSNPGAVMTMRGRHVLVTSGATAINQGSFLNFIVCNNNNQPLHGACYFAGFPRDQQVCLQDRFAVKIDNITNHPGDRRGTPVRFGSSDSAFFWFYNDKNFEVMVKVLNGCAINNHWWVFIAGTTNQGHRIQVGDATTNTIRTYTRNLGPPAPAITDTEAFDCP